MILKISDEWARLVIKKRERADELEREAAKLRVEADQLERMIELTAAQGS